MKPKQTHKNWLTTNLSERLVNPNVDFKVTVKPYKAKNLSFEDSFLYTANLFKKENVYIAFSGGADSEFLVRSYHKHKIPFTPLILIAPMTYRESHLALNVCKELSITPVVLHYTDEEWFNIFITDIHKKLNGKGSFCVPFIETAKYAQSQNGIVIQGNMHLFNYNDYEKPYINFYDYNHYADVLYPGTVVNFFFYTQEIARRMLVDNFYKDFHVSKYEYFGIPKREKIDFTFPDKYTDVLNKIYLYTNQQCNNRYQILRQDFLKMISN